MAGKTVRHAHSTRARRGSQPVRGSYPREVSGLRGWRPSASNLMEGCWLALALLTPSLFNPASLRVFEAEKVAFVRAVAIAMAAIWVVEVLVSSRSKSDAAESGRAQNAPTARALFHTPSPTLPLAHSLLPVGLPVAALMACYLLASLFSELPGVAVFGSYRRQFGLVTHLSFAVIFLVVASHLRTPAQGRRLLHAIALGALVPSAYAVLQKLGADPIGWSVDHSRRVVGTLGQPTFLGAYLAWEGGEGAGGISWNRRFSGVEKLEEWPMQEHVPAYLTG